MKHFLIFALIFMVFFCGCAQKAQEVSTTTTIPPEDANMKNIQAKLTVSSAAFSENSTIPAKYTCDGQDINPPLSIDGIPSGVKTLVLFIDDPDAPSGVWDHWVVWNIEPAAQIKENLVPKGGVQGVASDGRNAYHGPCPPSGTHRYRFKVYALDASLNLPAASKKKDVEKVMDGHILAKGVLTGLYGSK